ncbi:MAG: ABC transporter ATP-binding protein [Pirellula sp.]
MSCVSNCFVLLCLWFIFGPHPYEDSSGVLLELTSLRYAYGDRLAVQDVSLCIMPGQIFGLLGPNGAGKTTTLSCISGALSKWSGSISMNGKPFIPSREPKHRGLLGIVPQELAIYDTLTARENLCLFAKLCGVPKSEQQNSIDEFIAFAGLEQRQNDLVSQFSGGMKRRLNLAIGLLHRPPLVLMDEPTVGVDPQSRNHIFESIEKIKASGTSVLYTTHYMEEAERLCDIIAIMDNGSIVVCGAPDELMASMNDPNATMETVFLTLTGRNLKDE